jgi:hypothetical protein
MFRGSCRSQHRLFRGYDSRLAHLHLSAGHLPCIHPHGIARNGLRRGERLLARGHNGARNPLVHIGYVVHGGVIVYHRRLIIVVHYGAVDGGVGNVYVFNVPFAHAVRRHVHFTWTQREPTYRPPATTDRDAHAEPTAADECDERRCVHRTHINYAFNSWRRRYPSPSVFHVCPASVVERREAPRLVINPGVSPRLDIRPMAIVIRRPVRDFNTWIPYVAIFRRIAPVSVVVQIFIPDHVLRNILSRPGMFPSAVTVGAPRVKLVVIRVEVLHVSAQLIRSRKNRVVMRANGIRRSPAGDLAFPVANSDRGGIAAFINVDAIGAWPCNRESQIRRIDFVGLVFTQMTNAH